MSSNTLPQFEALCEATRNFLNGVPSVTPAMHAQHATNIEMHLNRMQGKAELLQPRMLQAIRSLPFPQTELDRLTARLSDLATAASAPTGFQNWIEFPRYMTAAKIAQLRSLTTPEQMLLDLAAHAHALGLRHASEPTFQILTAIHLELSGNTGMSVHEKKQVLERFKASFRRLGVNSAVESFVVVLPTSPSDFRTACPNTFSAVLGTNPQFQIVQPDPVQWIPSCI